jgi:hypothetical protein
LSTSMIALPEVLGMDASENFNDAFARACARERELWQLIRGKHPGDPNCPEGLWREWLEAARLVRVLATEHAGMIAPQKQQPGPGQPL